MTNILYLISCFGHGRGGHFYSLKALTQELGRDHAVSIVSVGSRASPVYADMRNYTSIKTALPGPRAIWRMIQLIRESGVKVIHSFDPTAHMFASIVSSLTGIAVIHTKCGGPPPRRPYPAGMRDLVLFSAEDLCYFQASRRHRNTKLHLIPNRVSACPSDHAAISDLRKRLRPGATILLRIARFSESHKKSIHDTVELARRLHRDGLNVQLVLVGVVQSREVYESVKAIASADTVFATDDRFTINASGLIGMADAVVGTGRGAMEAAMAGTIVLAPVSMYATPVLIRQNNIETFAERNFSPRVELAGSTEDKEYANVLGVLTSREESTRLRSYIADYAGTHFDIARVRDKYDELYANAGKCRAGMMDLGRGCLRSMRRRWTTR